MAGRHTTTAGLFVPADSALHRLPPQCKLVAGFAFVLVVVATPREAFWAFGAYAALLAGAARLGRLPLGFVLRRLTIEAPFVAFAFFMPFFGQGDKVDVLGLPLYVDGLWAAWNILVKGTLGVATTVVLAGTTPVAELLRGMDRLHVPRVFTSIAGFMVRYLEVITDEMHRMSVARRSRGYDPRWLWQAKAVAVSAGALFIRSYERGERVYLAMVSRGFDGSLPVLAEEGGAPARQWAFSLALPAAAAAIAVTAIVQLGRASVS